MNGLDRIQAALADALAEREALQRQTDAAKLEAHHARRRLEVEQENNRRLVATVTQLEQRTRNAEQVADQSRRAALDHAART